MSSSIENLKSKVERVVQDGLHGATTELEMVSASEKLSGFVIWEAFTGESHIERQRALWKVLRAGLDNDEQRALSAILTVSPAEIASLRSEDN